MFEGSFTAKLRVKRDFKRCTGWLGNESIQNINHHGENACRQNIVNCVERVTWTE